MYTIVGLGNPGAEYKHTRHNVGWMVLESFASAKGLPSFVQSGTYAAQLSEGMLGETEVAVLLPTSYMNNSGGSVAKYLNDHAAETEKLVVVHDDVDLALGDVRISFDRGGGGHNGVQSIINSCGSKQFIRVRVGIAPTGFFGGVKRPKGEKLSTFVLGAFTKRDLELFPSIAEKVEKALMFIVEKGVVRAMEVCNGK